MTGPVSPLLALALFVLSSAAADSVGAVEYRLQVANLTPEAMTSFLDGPIVTGSGELRMDRLEKALDGERRRADKSNPEGRDR